MTHPHDPARDREQDDVETLVRVLREGDELAYANMHSDWAARSIARTILTSLNDGPLARVKALAEPMGDYHHYVVELDDGVHLAVLVDDLRSALTEETP